jgi:hypothetical protein
VKLIVNLRTQIEKRAPLSKAAIVRVPISAARGERTKGRTREP